MMCDICQNKQLTEDPALLYIDAHKFHVCDECEMLLSVITEKVELHNASIANIEINDEQSI
jgi:hypothetical protein